MRKFILAAAVAGVALPIAATPAEAQPREVRQEQRECERELRRADNRRESRRDDPIKGRGKVSGPPAPFFFRR